MMKARYLFILLCFIYTSSSGQLKDGIDEKITGTWVLNKHLAEVAGNIRDCVDDNVNYYYTFLPTGNYEIHYEHKVHGNSITKGKWEIIRDGTSIHLYESVCNLPGIISDHDIPIVSFSGDKIVLNEFLFSEWPIGTSTYTKKTN